MSQQATLFVAANPWESDAGLPKKRLNAAASAAGVAGPTRLGRKQLLAALWLRWECEHNGLPAEYAARYRGDLVEAMTEAGRVAPEFGWPADAVARRSACEAGEAVVANAHRGEPDEELVAWAKATGRLVRVDRRSEWGNPFKPKGRSRRERDRVCDEFALHLAGKPDLLARVAELRAKVLLCWCHPERCHGHHLNKSQGEGN